MKIPAGIDEGDRIRLSMKAEGGQNGGPSGDLYIQDPHQAASSVFAREGNDLLCEMPISFARRRWGRNRDSDAGWRGEDQDS